MFGRVQIVFTSCFQSFPKKLVFQLPEEQLDGAERLDEDEVRGEANGGKIDVEPAGDEETPQDECGRRVVGQ